MSKKRGKKVGRIKDLSIQFIPFSEIRNLDSDSRIKKILDIVLGNNIIILQGRLKVDEESRLIGDTMAMIDHVREFKGIELAVIADNNGGLINKLRSNLANIITRGETGAVTIIGPASIVREIKRDPKKIELFLNK